MNEKKEIKEFSIRNKAICAFVLLIVVLVLCSFALTYTGVWMGRIREAEQEELKMSSLLDFINDVYAQRDTADRRFTEFVSRDVRFMSGLLREFLTEDGYDGPRTFRDGFVAELRGDEVLLPDGILKGEMDISRGLIKESIASGSMMTGRLLVASDHEDALKEFLSEEPNKEDYSDTAVKTCFLSFGEISDRFIYVDVTSEIEYLDTLDAFTYNAYAALDAADQSYGGVTLAVSVQDGELRILRSYGNTEGFEDLKAIGIDAGFLSRGEKLLNVNGTSYRCAVIGLDLDRIGEDNSFVIQLLPQVSHEKRSAPQSILLCLMTVILLTIIVYVVATQRYTRKNVLTGEQAERYRPSKMRLRMTAAGIIGTLLIFFSAVLIQSLNQLYVEIRYGQDTLEIYSEHLGYSGEQRRKAVKEKEEDWYVYYGKQLASLLTEYPKLARRDVLQSACDVLGIDYIMLFDASGKETLCSGEYIDFTMDKGLGADSSDFRRLLLGVPSIVHDPSYDKITGLERKMIGVRLDDLKEKDKYGALIMALPPDSKDTEDYAGGVSQQLSSMASKGTLCFAADADTGTIQYASDLSLIGRTITDLGLSEESLGQIYMDFGSIDGNHHFVIAEQKDGAVYYYAVEFGRLFHMIFTYGFICAALFVITLTLTLNFLMRGYTEQLYTKWAKMRLTGIESDSKVAKLVQDKIKASGTDGTNLLDKMTARGLKFLETVGWEREMPEEKACVILRVGVALLVLTSLGTLLRESLLNHNSLFRFLLFGNWVRGLNLFSLSSVLIVFGIAYLINLTSDVILRITAGFLSANGETVCRLLYSCLKYLTAFGVLYYSLGYLGFPTSTVVASLGIVSLALSLGAKDLIADILSGIAIVFEDSFQVGDIVELNGKRGKVMELGMRSTKMKVDSSNILVLNNHEIRDILNLSKESSRVKVEFQISNQEPLAKVEALLEQNLPEIGEKFDKILSGPSYLGVISISGKTMQPTKTLGIVATCEQKDMEKVSLFLNREISLLFEQEKIELK